MRYFIITVRDSAADSFHAPLFFPAIGQAERWFRDECRTSNPDAALAKHPEDYELYLLGAFLASTAEIISETPRLLLRGIDCLKKDA